MSDLDLPLVHRELEPADISRLVRGSLRTKPQVVKKIRHTHHNLARLIASGVRHEEISQITGYSPAYISSLSSSDPAFKNLIGYYQSMISEESREVQVSLNERLIATSMLAAEELQERLTESPEEFSVNELNDILKTTADRTGFGPQTKNTNVNVNVDLAARLESARRRISAPEGVRGPSIEGSLASAPPNDK